MITLDAQALASFKHRRQSEEHHQDHRAGMQKRLDGRLPAGQLRKFNGSRGPGFAASGSFSVRWPASSLPSVWAGRREEEKGLAWELWHVNDDSDVPCAQSPVQILLTMESRLQQETPVGDAVLVGSYKSSPYYQRTRRISPRLHLGLSRKRS